MSRESPGGVRALVLAGGLGTRLRPVVPDLPKVLAPVAGVPFLAHVLGWLQRWGVREVVLCLGYRAEQVIAAAPGLAAPDQRLHFSVEPEPRGTAGALRLARGWAGERVLVLNGDSLPALDLGAMVAAHLARGCPGTLAAARVPDGTRYGTLEVADDGRVRAFRAAGTPGPALVNAGVYLLEPAGWPHLEAGDSLERDVLPRMAAAGALAAFAGDVGFADMGTPEGYRLIAGRVTGDGHAHPQ